MSNQPQPPSDKIQQQIQQQISKQIQQQAHEASEQQKNPLALINSLIQRSIRSKDQKALAFNIVNDPIRILRYDRATLWIFRDGKPKLQAVSGQPSFSEYSPFIREWTQFIEQLPSPNILHKVTIPPETKEFKLPKNAILYWIPGFVEKDLVLGLLVEYWDRDEKELPIEAFLKLIQSSLFNTYAAEWQRFNQNSIIERFKLNRLRTWGTALLIASFVLFGVRLPLRIVAPSEVVPKDPYLVTAPLDGIIKQVVVMPGTKVSKGDLLFSYEDEVLLRQLEAAQKEVKVNEAEVKRALVQGLADEQVRDELAVKQLQLEKEKVALSLAEYQASKINVVAEEDGIVMMNNPDEWRGKPVKMGEKVLTINNPTSTKVKIWIPEDDNIPLNLNHPLKVFLNTAPTKSYEAKVNYIAYESNVDLKDTSSFIAEANWIEQPPDVKLGLKGSAVLYGEDVSLAYYLIRRPLVKLRYILGI